MRDLSGVAEAAVVALAMAGDDRAFHDIVRRRQAWVIGLMRRLSGDGALAEDLAQLAFMQAWRTIRTLRSPAAFGAWLRQVAVNVWLQEARRSRLMTTSIEAVDEAALGHGELREQLDLGRALALLPAAERLCVVLNYAEGLSHGEIVAATGLPLGTVKSHVSRGAARLRQWLGERDDG